MTSLATGEPITDVQIAILNTVLGTRSGADGRYSVARVPAGAQRLRAVRIGFQEVVLPVTVTAGDTVTVDFRMSPSAIQLGQVVVSATGEQVQKRSQGVTVASINTDTVQLAPIQNFSQLIQGRAAGVNITQSGGALGSGATVRIRGANSLNQSNEPLIVIDGVRVESGANSFSLGTGGQAPSRLNDLNPEDIESIEILKGPAASTLYGTAAANGVIQVTTKKGRAGAPRWQTWAEYGTVENVADFADNWAIVTTEGDTIIGGLPGVAAGDYQLANTLRYQPLDNTSLLREGDRQQYGLSVSGGTEAARYYVSGEWDGENGIYANNDQTRINLRANVSATVRPNLEASFNAGYLTSDLALVQNDNNGLGILPQGYLGLPYPGSTGGWFAFDPAVTAPFTTNQETERFVGSTNWNYRPVQWLNLIATGGVDALTRDDNNLLPPNVILTSANNRIGFRSRNYRQALNYTGTLSAVTQYPIFSELRGNTTVGGQYIRSRFTGTDAFGRNVLVGTGSLDGTSSQFAVDETNVDERTVGFYGKQQFSWADRIFVTAAFRTDANSNFGDNVGWVTYPQVEGSWVVNEESFFPENRWLNGLRLRAAWGQSGLPPGFREAREFFTPVAVRVQGVESSGFTLGGAGNTALDPEVISETELGFDASFLDNRVGLEFTYFSKIGEDAIVARRLAPSLGATTTQLANIGEIANWGTEWLLNANLFNGFEGNFALDATVNFTTLRQNLNSLREGVEPIIFGLGGDSQRHQPGFPMGGYWGFTYTYADANDDGLIGEDEVTYSDDQSFLGTPEPRRNLGVTLNATFLKNIRFSTLVDYRGGHKLFNSTTEFRCGFRGGLCEGLNNPDASLELQAASIAAQNGSIAGFVEDADFVRLREVAVTLTAPQNWANRIGVQQLGLTFAGRNLGLWTDYSGPDPEINFAGQAGFTRADFLSQPPVRSYTARLQITY